MAQERPVHEVRLGKVKAAIWKNETDNGVRLGVTFTRIYKTDNGWENSLSFGRDELPLVGSLTRNRIQQTELDDYGGSADAH